MAFVRGFRLLSTSAAQAAGETIIQQLPESGANQSTINQVSSGAATVAGIIGTIEQNLSQGQPIPQQVTNEVSTATTQLASSPNVPSTIKPYLGLVATGVQVLVPIILALVAEDQRHDSTLLASIATPGDGTADDRTSPAAYDQKHKKVNPVMHPMLARKMSSTRKRADRLKAAAQALIQNPSPQH
jgi:hypothetical protein